jgi:hypothetical protein
VHLEEAVSTCTLRVYDTLRDTLTVEVREFFNKMYVLQQDWSTLTDGL